MRQNEKGRVDEPARTDGLTKESIDSDYSKTFLPGEGVRGRLQDIIESDGEDFILASLQDDLYEIPRGLAPAMWPLVGQRVILANIGGQVRAGRCS